MLVRSYLDNGKDIVEILRHVRTVLHGQFLESNGR